MPTLAFRQRLVNPGVRKRRRNAGSRRMTLKQKLHFGSPAQRRAAAKALSGKRSTTKRRRNPARKRKATAAKRTVKRSSSTRSKGRKTATISRRKTGHRKRLRYSGVSSRGVYKYVLNPKRKRRVKRTRKASHRRRRLANVGQIITLGLSGNPGRKRKRSNKRRVSNMARRRRRNYGHRRRRTRRVSNASLLRRLMGGRRRRRSNPGRRRRGGFSSRRRYSRRRSNPGFLSGTGTQVGGIIAGAALTKFVFDKLIPAQYAVGWTGYAVNALVAYLQGYLVARFAGKPALGASMQMGGYTMVALRIMNDFAPGLSSYSALGLRGALARSSFYVPQVPQPNSMTQFVTPSAIMQAIPAPSMKGIRTGRV